MGFSLSHSPVGPHWSLADPFNTYPCSQENSQLDPLWKLPEALRRQFMWPLSGLDKALHWNAEPPKQRSENIAVERHLTERTQFIWDKAALGELETLRSSLDSWEDGCVFFEFQSLP